MSMNGNRSTHRSRMSNPRGQSSRRGIVGDENFISSTSPAFKGESNDSGGKSVGMTRASAGLGSSRAESQAVRPPSRPWVLLVQNDLWPDGVLPAMLETEGFRVAGPFSEACQASDWLSGHAPVAAVLDVALWDGASFDLAHELGRREVPFFFFTSWTDVEQIPPELREVTFLEKPKHGARVAKLVVNLARKRSRNPARADPDG